MVYPVSLSERLKYLLWRVITPVHPYVRDALLWSRVIRHEGRQDYLIGHIAPGLSIEDTINHLIEKGFANHFVAWRDDGEVVSLRRTTCFEYQYHIRIFEDGEVRAHYEYTTEHKPIKHIKGIGMEDRRHEFREILGNTIVPIDNR